MIDPTTMTGWITAITTAGLLGPMLYWLCYVHLPSKDRQTKELIEAHSAHMTAKDDAHALQIQNLLETHAAEREKDRASRHGTANMFQKALAEVIMQSSKDAEVRNEVLKQAIVMLKQSIDLQTSVLTQAQMGATKELKESIEKSCKFSK